MAQRKARGRRSNGEGSTYYDKATDRWRGVVRWVDDSGKMSRKTFSARTEAEVLARIGDAQSERRKGRAPVVGPQVTVAEYAGQWLEDSSTTIRGSTLVSYRRAIGHVVAGIGAKRMRDVTVQDIAGVVTRVHRQTPATAAYVRRVASIMWHAAERDGVVDRNVASLSPTPRVVRRETVVLDPDQVRTLVAGVTDDTVGAFIASLALTGMRFGELAALTWGDVDLDAATIAVISTMTVDADNKRTVGVPKSAAGRRVVHIPAMAVQVLTRQQGRSGFDPEDLVFPSTTGTPMHASTVNDALRATCLRLGLPVVNPHALRHAYATLLVASGVDVHTVAGQLGHGSAALVLKTYGHALTERRKAAAGVLDRALGAVS